MGSARAVAMAVSALVAVSLLVGPSAESAPQHWPTMAVSRDGKTWGRQLHGPLFPPTRSFVPGDAMEREFLVRNQSGEAATLGVLLKVRHAHGWLRTSGLRFSVRAAKGTWIPVTQSGRQRTLRRPIAAGQVRRIQVRVAMLARAGNGSMARRTPFRVRLTMTAARAR
jgi:hypothetical protein